MNLKGCIRSLIVSFCKLRKYKVSGNFVFRIFCIFEYFSFHFCILGIYAEERIPRKFIPKKQEMCAPIKYATLKHLPPPLKIHSKHFLRTEFQSYDYFQFAVFRAEWEFGLDQLESIKFSTLFLYFEKMINLESKKLIFIFSLAETSSISVCLRCKLLIFVCLEIHNLPLCHTFKSIIKIAIIKMLINLYMVQKQAV